MPKLSSILMIFSIVAIPVPFYAQEAGSSTPAPISGPKPSSAYSERELEKLVPAARPEDVSSPEAIIRAVHESASGPRGEWNPDRFRSLFIPDAFFGYDDVGADGSVRISTITLNDLVKELQRHHRQTSWYEKIVDVPTLIRIRRDKQVILVTLSATGVEGPHPVLDNSEQKTSTTTLMYIGARWWIVSHVW
jgi:hypothetical protein